MDDLGTAISGFLEQPGAMEQLEAVAKQLGIGPGASEPEQPEAPEAVETAAFSELSPEKLGPVLKALGASSQPTPETKLLEALRPFLSHDEKVDRAKRALGLMHALRTAAGTFQLEL